MTPTTIETKMMKAKIPSLIIESLESAPLNPKASTIPTINWKMTPESKMTDEIIAAGQKTFDFSTLTLLVNRLTIAPTTDKVISAKVNEEV